MTLRRWWNADPHAELDFEIDGFKCTARFSGHYYNQGDADRHWACYGIQWHVESCPENVSESVSKQAWKKAKLIAVTLQRDFPPHQVYEDHSAWPSINPRYEEAQP